MQKFVMHENNESAVLSILRIIFYNFSSLQNCLKYEDKPQVDFSESITNNSIMDFCSESFSFFSIPSDSI